MSEVSQEHEVIDRIRLCERLVSRQHTLDAKMLEDHRERRLLELKLGALLVREDLEPTPRLEVKPRHRALAHSLTENVKTIEGRIAEMLGELDIIKHALVNLRNELSATHGTRFFAEVATGSRSMSELASDEGRFEALMLGDDEAQEATHG